MTVRNDGDRPFALGALDAGLMLDNLQQVVRLSAPVPSSPALSSSPAGNGS